MKAKLLNVLLAFALAVAMLTPTHPVRAATTWFVRSTGDGVATPANCPGTGCRLRDAIAAAAPGDTIQFHLPIPSTITLTNGEINIQKDLILSGMGSTKLTINGNNTNRIFYLADSSNISISGMRLTNGRAVDTNGGAIFNQNATVFLDDLIVAQNIVVSSSYHHGGAICNFATMTITNSQITNNSAPYSGGIYSAHGTTLNMTNVTVSDNQSTAAVGQGGGIYLAAQSDIPSTMNMDNVIVSGNTSTGSAGGIEVGSDAVVSIKNSSISGNNAQAGSGGGLNIEPTANVIIENSTINGNHSTEDGGGIWLTEATLTISDSTVSLNTAGSTSNDEGGGILSAGTSTVTLTRGTINSNSAGRGGGVSSFGTATLTNVTLSGNSASFQAGGINNYGTMDIHHITLAGNSAVNHTGGIAANIGSTTNIRNSIIADNIAPISADCSGNHNSQGYNLIEDVDLLNCFIIGDTTTNITGQDPMLDALSDNGGSTLTMNLLANSPAIDSADNATCTIEDQRTYLRPQDGDDDNTNECDMGAVEYAPYPVLYSITRTDPNPTSAAQVNFTVRFSEPVSNVVIGNFDLIIGGSVAGASLVSVIGSGLKYTVTVNTGSGNGSIQLKLIDDDSILSSFSGDPLGGPGAGNGNALGDSYIKVVSLTFKSSAVSDGWILESSETNNTGGTLNSDQKTFILGDDAVDRQYRAILHFDTSALPDTAVVTNMTLKIKQQGSVAGISPFSFGSLYVDMRNPAFGGSALELTDFNFTAKKVKSAVFNPNPVSGWFSARFNNGGKLYVNHVGTTQLRLYFSVDDNNNNIADFIRFFSGNAAAGDRPKLVIQYYVP